MRRVSGLKICIQADMSEVNSGTVRGMLKMPQIPDVSDKLYTMKSGCHGDPLV